MICHLIVSRLRNAPGKWMVEILSRLFMNMCSRELQQLAKRHKLKANAKSSDLINQLIAMHASSGQQDENNDLSNSVVQRSSPLLARRKHEQRRKTISRITMRGSPSGLNSSFEQMTLGTLSPLRNEFRPQEKSVAELCQLSVNAIMALNCKNGAKFEQIFSFLKMHVGDQLTMDKMKQVLVYANENNRIVAVQDGKTSDVRFLIPGRVKHPVSRPAHKKPFPGSQAFMRSALHNAMVLERTRRIDTREAYSQQWSRQLNLLDSKIHSKCTCKFCGCAGAVDKPPSKPERKPEIDVKRLHPQLKAVANSKKKSRRFSLQALYRSSSKGSAEKAEKNEKLNKTIAEVVSVPAGWELMESRTKPGKFYYYNPVTNERMWKEPGQ